MKNRILTASILLLLLILVGCGPTYPEDNTQTQYPTPQFSEKVLRYNVMREELHCEVNVKYDSSFTELVAKVELTGFNEDTLTLVLNDTGIFGDALAGDDVYSRNVLLDRIDSVNGNIYVQYELYNGSVKLKDTTDTLAVEANLPPVITEITMPDTIVRPLTGTKALLISLGVDDPNGVYDVINAFFQVLSNSTGQWSSDYTLNDTGELGDEIAGDGIFSTGLQISSSNTAATNYFRFRVKDTASNFSDWSLDSVVVR